MPKQHYMYFEKQLMAFVDVSIDILSKIGRTEFFYCLSEEDMKQGTGRKRFSAGFIEEFANYLKSHSVGVEYIAKFKMFKITLNLTKCSLDLHRFEAVTEALKNFPKQKAITA
jgi:hypothetical protein